MPINTPTKRKKISELKIGDEVLAWDGNTIHPQKIKDIIKHSVEINDLLKVTFQKETSRKNIKPGIFSIICTKEHIFWNSNNSPAEAQNLVPGQELYEITDNVIKIISISPITHHNELRGCERDGKKVVVYDLKLEEGAHVFFSNRVGSHNCGSAIASSSLVSEMIKGLTISEALEIKNTDIANELALPPVKIHCSILAEDSLKAAIADYKNKQNK
ncbi:MAG: iron-sulfur cluster assembly scaffold protein [Fischerella sp.]|nr:iron-sulfur cluster assembly scaffold protein [Fischerella sp.]